MATIKSSNEGLILEADGANTIQFRNNNTNGMYIQSNGEMNTNGKLIHGVKNGLTSNVTYQIGSTGDFLTINTALKYLSKVQPDYDNAGITVTLNLEAGFVMTEQVLVRGIDLGWITITGTDAETSITHTALTIDFTTDDYGFISYPAFGVSKGGTLPRIGQLFRMSSGTTPEDGKHGIIAVGSGSSAEVLSGAGVQDAGTNCCYCVYCANINCKDSIFSGAGTNGVAATQGATINAYSVDASGAGDTGIFSHSGSTINAYGVDASGAGTYGCFANQCSIINAYISNAQGSGTYDYYVMDSGIIDISGAIGSPTYSQTLNTWTDSGWIGS